MKRFSAFHMIPAAALGMILSCCACQSAQDLPWYEDTDRLWQDYMAAVEDAKEATSEEMDPDLAAIISPEESPQVEWLERNGRTFVLVGSVMSGEDSRYWENGSGTDSGFILDDRLPWVTLPYDLTTKLQSAEIQSEDAGIEMRVIQMLGLPPDCGYDRIVFFWAEKDSLFRPAHDPEIYDREVLLDFRNDVDPRYRAWFEDYRQTAYFSDTPYPWTRLGYTYDWNAETGTETGPAEFIVRPGTRVIVQDILCVPEWYHTAVNLY